MGRDIEKERFRKTIWEKTLEQLDCLEIEWPSSLLWIPLLIVSDRGKRDICQGAFSNISKVVGIYKKRFLRFFPPKSPIEVGHQKYF